MPPVNKRFPISQTYLAPIGDNSVIGGGSVVTKDIPANVIAVGNPCHVLREIGEDDRKYYYRDYELDFDPDSDQLP